MRRYPILALLAISIAFIVENTITEEDLKQIEKEERYQQLDFCLVLSSIVLIGILMRNIVLILYTHL